VRGPSLVVFGTRADAFLSKEEHEPCDLARDSFAVIALAGLFSLIPDWITLSG
jgi:hypothetical protein